MAEFSIIIPVYNVAKYLKQSLDSVINQTFTDVEIICVNDGSTDESLSILNDYASKDSRFVIISQANQGQGVARNNAIKIAKGKYLLFLDPDDWLDLNAVQTLADKFNETDADVIQFNYSEYIEKTGKVRSVDFAKLLKKKCKYDVSKLGFYSWKNLKCNFLYSIGLQVWNRAYKTSFVRGCDISFAPSKQAEDHIFANKTLLSADRIYYIDKYLYNYRVRYGSAVSSFSVDNWKIFENINLLKEFLETRSLFPVLEAEFEQYKIHVLGWHIRQIPQTDRPRFIELAKSQLSKKGQKAFVKMAENRNSFLENIFSIKNLHMGIVKYKMLTILGIRIVFDKDKNVKEGNV